MRYTVTSQQFDFFREKGHIQFLGLLSVEEARSLKEHLDEAKHVVPSGRDLERGKPGLKKAMFLARLSQAASGLLDKLRLQLAFTQYIPPYGITASLEEISSVTEVCCCAIVKLSDDPNQELGYLPQEIGDVGFYSKSFPIDFTKLTTPFLIVALATENGRYKLQPNDPHTHLLKKLGYAFGDRLLPETHPILVKD